jgi:peptide-methionine (S)-S-oxide reductase
MSDRPNSLSKHVSLVAAILISGLFTGVLASSGTRAAESARLVPAPVVDEQPSGNRLETAVLAGGCFWGMQGVFEHVKGVHRVVAGYAGGRASTAHYRIVGTETTKHAESVKITYDPSVVTYGQLLRVYFSVAHDPTQLNRQGPDTGPSYRSEIFYIGDEQRRIAAAYIAQLQGAGVFSDPIVTKVEELPAFYPAEGYHQDYLIKHPNAAYIVVNDLPKIANLKRLLPDLYMAKPAALEAS